MLFLYKRRETGSLELETYQNVSRNKTINWDRTMMSLAVVSSLFILVAISLQPVEAGRRCWCNAQINGRVIKDFGVIASCGGWCGCGDSRISRCGLTCDEKVQKWAETSCLKPYQGQHVKSHYKASSCHTSGGGRPYTCKYCSKKITKRVAYTCYKDVTQTVQVPCATPPKKTALGPSNPLRRPSVPAMTLHPHEGKLTAKESALLKGEFPQYK